MNSYLIKHSLSRQGGVATLFIAIMMLTAITLVALLSSKTVITEAKMAANNYRTTQSVAAANYAMDLGVNYFDTGGFDRFDVDGNPGFDGVVDSKHIDLNNDGVADGGGIGMDTLSLTSTDGSQTILAELSFDEFGCGASGIDFTAGMITVTGYSDINQVAQRTITQCVGPIGILRDDGPKQPLVAQGQVALTGNARIVNRFTSTTIWSGDQVTIGSSSAMETYIGAKNLSLIDQVDGNGNPIDDGDPDTLNISDPVDIARLLSTDEDVDTQLVSNRNLGNGLDIIDDDSTLDTLIGLEFFKNFFHAEARSELKLLAGAQVYNKIDLAKNGTEVTSGLVWIEGDQAMNGGVIGSIEAPVIVYIHGDFKLTGATIYGVLYVAGVYEIAGNPTIVGANIVEGTKFSGTNPIIESPADPPAVWGAGTISLIYWAGLSSPGPNPDVGKTAVIAGSWRDWDL